MDFILFRQLRALFGGNIKIMLTGETQFKQPKARKSWTHFFPGGAPLSKETHDFIRTCMGCPVLQGYGLTETCACATVMEFDELSTETVGPPNQLMQVGIN